MIDENQCQFDDDSDEEVMIGYECVNCGHVQSTGISCDKCLGHCMDPIFE